MCSAFFRGHEQDAQGGCSSTNNVHFQASDAGETGAWTTRAKTGTGTRELGTDFLTR